MRLGTGELILIVIVVLLVFGGRRLPELGRSLGEAIREFQRGTRGDSDKDGHSSKKEPK